VHLFHGGECESFVDVFAFLDVPSSSNMNTLVSTSAFYSDYFNFTRSLVTFFLILLVN
jgi:hypothetical protein